MLATHGLAQFFTTLLQRQGLLLLAAVLLLQVLTTMPDARPCLLAYCSENFLITSKFFESVGACTSASMQAITQP